MGGLGRSSLPLLTRRVERILMSAISRGNNRLTSGLNIIRLAVTLREIFSSPGSGVV